MLPFLFSLPDYQKCCVHSMQYIFSYMLQQKMVFPSLDYFQLVHSPHPHEGVFLRIDPKTWTYCTFPHGFHIQCIKEIPETSCPHADHHALWDLFHELSRVAQPRYPALARLWQTLSTENGAVSVQQCSFCTQRSDAVDGLLKSFQKEYPFLTRSSIDVFYRFPVRGGVSQEILKPHVASMHALFSQIRNPSIREQLVQGIYDALCRVQDKVEEAVQRNDDETMRSLTRQFKSLVLDTIDCYCPFVHVRKIEFQRWLLTLVYFMSIQKQEPLENEAPLRLIKKTILLLHLYFHTPSPLDSESVFHVQEETDSYRISLDWESLNRIHPAMRGECLRV